jgi:hypothetical protein
MSGTIFAHLQREQTVWEFVNTGTLIDLTY